MFSTVAEPFYIPTKCLQVPIFLDPCLNINIDFVRLLSGLKEMGVSKGRAGSRIPPAPSHHTQCPYLSRAHLALQSSQPHCSSSHRCQGERLVVGWDWTELEEGWQDKGLPCDDISLSTFTTAPSPSPCPGTVSLAIWSPFRRHLFFL